MNRVSTSRSKGLFSRTPDGKAEAPKVTGKGKVTKSAPHGKVRIPPSLG